MESADGGSVSGGAEVTWLLRFWPWHEHLYSIVRPVEVRAGFAREGSFRCRCGHEISGDELFSPDTVMGRYWRAR